MQEAAITRDTLSLFAKALGGYGNADDLRKSVTTGTGLVGYDLQAPAKNLYPYLAPLVGDIPREAGETGTATHWNVVSAINGSGYNAMGWVPEGQRSARMSYSTSSKAATYVTIGEEDQVSFEATTAARGYEDVRATAAIRLLQKMRIKEDEAILGGNTSIALGTPVAPTVSSASTGGSIAAGTYLVSVVALTYEGYRNWQSTSKGSANIAPLPTSQMITGADGLTYTLSGGSSNAGASASTGALSGSTNTISASIPVINGAVAYAWFVGVSGTQLLQAVTTINSVLLTSLFTSNAQNLTAITADNSKNTTVPAFDGLLTAVFNQGGVNVSSLATGTAGTGTALTSSGRGSVNEIDAILQALWDNYNLGIDTIWVNSQESKNLTSKVLNGTSAPLLRYMQGDSEKGAEYRLAASGRIDYYFNPYAVDGGEKIPIKIHPRLPAGTILGYTKTLPPQYQNNAVPRPLEVRTRRDYYEIDWPLHTRQYEMGVYAEEVLAVYAPFSMFVLNNIANA